MATVSTIIIRALQMIGEKSIGASLSSGEQTAYLAVLIAAMETWGLDPLNSYAVTEDSKALTTGTGSYTIGSGATWNTARPSKIIGAFVRDGSSIDRPVKILDEEGYRLISLKSNGNSTPAVLWYNPDYVTAFGKIYLYPLPTASLTLYIHSPRQLQTFSTVGDTLLLPPGYQDFIEAHLAIRLATGFTKASNELLAIARETKAAIQGVNIPARHMTLDAGLLQSNRRGAWTGSIITGP